MDVATVFVQNWNFFCLYKRYVHIFFSFVLIFVLNLRVKKKKNLQQIYEYYLLNFGIEVYILNILFFFTFSFLKIFHFFFIDFLFEFYRKDIKNSSRSFIEMFIMIILRKFEITFIAQPTPWIYFCKKRKKFFFFCKWFLF